MSIQHSVEAAADALIAKLEQSLPPKIDDINAEAEDRFVVEYPTEIAFGPRSESAYPFISVSPDTSEAPTDASGRILYDHRVRVVSWLQDSEEEGLSRKLIRFQRAVREVILVKRRPTENYSGYGGYGLQHVGDEYGPTFGGEASGAFVSWVASTFAIQQQEDIP